MGCSESSSTAGVLSETESGQTASLTVSAPGHVGDIFSSTKFALTRIIDNRTTVIDSAVGDNDGNVTFKKVPYNDFSIVVTALDDSNNVVLTSIVSSESLAKSGMISDSGFVNDSVEVHLGAPAVLLIRNDVVDVSVGDSVCITRTLSCGVFDDAAKEAGYISIANVPKADYQQIEIVHGSEVLTDSVFWRVSTSDTNTVTREGVSYGNGDTLSYRFPQVSLLDSLTDKSLDSLLVPFRRKTRDSDYTVCAYDSVNSETFLDQNWNILPTSGFREPDSVTIWITLPPTDSDIQVVHTSTEINYDVETAYSRISYSGNVDAGDSIHKNVFKDSSFAFSFWMQADSALASSASDSTESPTIILSAMQDSVGFEIRQCGTKATEVCVKIYNGIDSAATDTMEYGKTAILDGERHHFAMAIHKRHLSIVVDGKVIRNTDLKLSEKFYQLENMIAGVSMEQALRFSFGDFIRKPEDRGWHRLNAWLQAFYELQKGWI